MCMLFMGKKNTHPLGSFEDGTLFGKIHFEEISKHGNLKWCFFFVFSFSHFLRQCILFKFVGNNSTQVKRASLFHLFVFLWICYVMGYFSHVCCGFIVPTRIGIIREGGIVLFHNKLANEGIIMLMKKGLECSNPWRPIVLIKLVIKRWVHIFVIWIIYGFEIMKRRIVIEHCMTKDVVICLLFFYVTSYSTFDALNLFCNKL